MSWSNLPPAWTLVSTTSSALLPLSAWTSTGMPRPSSMTDTEPSACSVTWICPAVAGHRLVDRVVDDLVDQVVQASRGRVADVHARAACGPPRSLRAPGCWRRYRRPGRLRMVPPSVAIARGFAHIAIQQPRGLDAVLGLAQFHHRRFTSVHSSRRPDSAPIRTGRTRSAILGRRGSHRRLRLRSCLALRAASRSAAAASTRASPRAGPCRRRESGCSGQVPSNQVGSGLLG